MAISLNSTYTTTGDAWVSSGGTWTMQQEVGRANRDPVPPLDMSTKEYVTELERLASAPPHTRISQETIERAKQNVLNAMRMPDEFIINGHQNIAIGMDSLYEATTGCGMYDPSDPDDGEDTG